MISVASNFTSNTAFPDAPRGPRSSMASHRTFKSFENDLLLRKAQRGTTRRTGVVFTFLLFLCQTILSWSGRLVDGTVSSQPCAVIGTLERCEIKLHWCMHPALGYIKCACTRGCKRTTFRCRRVQCIQRRRCSGTGERPFRPSSAFLPLLLKPCRCGRPSSTRGHVSWHNYTVKLLECFAGE